jgi:DNA repair protein RadD
MEPRYYQTECHKATFDYFHNNTGNPLIALPTGTGKSFQMAMFVTNALMLYPNQKILIITHVQELVAGNFAELLHLWPQAPAGINSSALGVRDYNKKAIFCGIASIHKSWEQFGKVDLILIDEAHLLSPNDETMYRQFISNLKTKNEYLKVIGYTATPFRLGQGYITDEGGIFTDICYDLTTLEAFNRLIREGYMAPLVPKKPNYELDISDVKLGQDGDYAKGQLQRAVDKYEITLRAMKEAREIAHDRNCWLTFASGVEHCEHISEIQTNLGITNVVIHSKISQSEREKRFELWKTGKVKSAIGFRVLTTGLNHPPIDFIADLYPTKSSSMHVQKYGRGTRPYDPSIKYIPGFDYLKENCMVADFARNTQLLGPINDPVIPKKKGEKGTGGAPVKVCNVCGTYNHATVRFCVSCNAEFSFQIKIKEEAGTQDIIKTDLPELKTFKVDHITYAKHTKLGGKPSLKVTYYSGLKMFTEYVCIEHDSGSFPKRKADSWWQQRADTNSPNTILAAIYLTDQLKKPSSVIVHINKKYPEIVNYEWNNTEIKTQTLIHKDDIELKDSIDTTESEWVDYDDSVPF